MEITTITGAKFTIVPDEIQEITANGFSATKILTRDRFGIENRYTVPETPVEFMDRMNSES